MFNKANSILKWARLAPEASKKKEQKDEHIQLWLSLLGNKTLDWEPDTNVFLDNRYKPVQRCGMTKILKKRFHGNYLPVENKQHRRSGKETGERFHRYIYHSLVCMPLLAKRYKTELDEHGAKIDTIQAQRRRMGKPPLKRLPKFKFDNTCQCKIKFHKTTVLRKEKASNVHLWVEQALGILRDNDVKLVGCELIASSQYGTTSIDALGWVGEETNIVNISWKTGYSQRTMHTPRTNPEYEGKMLGDASHIPNSEHMQHQLQQMVENEILQKGHNIEVNRNLLVYFGANNKNTPVVFDSDQHEFLNPKTEENQNLLSKLL